MILASAARGQIADERIKPEPASLADGREDEVVPLKVYDELKDVGNGRLQLARWNYYCSRDVMVHAVTEGVDVVVQDGFDDDRARLSAAHCGTNFEVHCTVCFGDVMVQMEEGGPVVRWVGEMGFGIGDGMGEESDVGDGDVEVFSLEAFREPRGAGYNRGDVYLG